MLEDLEVCLFKHRKFCNNISFRFGERPIFVCSSDSEKGRKKSKSGQTNVQEPTVSPKFSKICLLEGGIQTPVTQPCFQQMI